jgi:histidine kinase-like protein
VLAEWDLKPLAETAELLVSELVTNAVRASAGLPARHLGLPTVQLWLSADHERVLIEVWDADERMPVCEQPDPSAEHGRGLFLVETLSENWGNIPARWIPGQDRVGPMRSGLSDRAFLNIDERHWIDSFSGQYRRAAVIHTSELALAMFKQLARRIGEAANSSDME